MKKTPWCCSVHNHADFCDGHDPLSAMVDAASAQNIQYFGISCHAHTPIPSDAGAVLPRDMTAYRTAIEAVRAA